jgi:hypothetical protein
MLAIAPSIAEAQQIEDIKSTLDVPPAEESPNRGGTGCMAEPGS